MSEQELREKFEEHCRKTFPCGQIGEISDFTIAFSGSWDIWQACAESMKAENKQLRAERDAALERIAELEAKPADVPEGWQLVPMEPTMEMRIAGILADTETNGIRSTVGDIYQAMVAAAPKPKGMT